MHDSHMILELTMQNAKRATDIFDIFDIVRWHMMYIWWECTRYDITNDALIGDFKLCHRTLHNFVAELRHAARKSLKIPSYLAWSPMASMDFRCETTSWMGIRTPYTFICLKRSKQEIAFYVWLFVSLTRIFQVFGISYMSCLGCFQVLEKITQNARPFNWGNLKQLMKQRYAGSKKEVPPVIIYLNASFFHHNHSSIYGGFLK